MLCYRTHCTTRKTILIGLVGWAYLPNEAFDSHSEVRKFIKKRLFANAQVDSKYNVCCHPESVENPFLIFEKRDFQAVQNLAMRKILPALLKLRC